ncbi:MAG: methyltransferase domain-containing protein [Actinomycetota bacterium]|nr:methyltransferase domain-containing protein [Actinomycetota bacterium]
MSDPRTQTVARGYDEIADRFAAWATEIEDDPRARFRGELLARLPEGARVLELGCGGGGPDTQALAERFRVTGVDISTEQVARARANVPDAEFVQADMTELELPPGSFEAVAAFYSFNHVPRDLLPGLLDRIHGWLVPGGLFLTALGSNDTPGWTGEWLGTTMYFSGWPAETNRRLLGLAGFTLLLDEVVEMREPEGEATFHWVLGER